MPRLLSGSIRSLRRTRCLETLFSGGDVAWTPDGRTLFAMRGDVVMAIPVDDPVHSSSIGNEEEGLKLTSLCIDENNARLALAFSNGMLRELDIRVASSPREVSTWRGAHTSPVLIMCYSPDSSLLATGSADCCVMLWDVSGHRLVAKLRGPSVVSALAFVSPRRVAIGYMEGLVKIFDAEDDGSYTLSHEAKFHSSRVTSLRVDTETGYVVATSRDQTATLIDTNNGQKKSTVLLFEPCESAVVVPDSRLFTVGEEGVLKEWNMQKSKLIRSLKLTTEGLQGISYNSVRNELLIVTATHNLFFVHLSTMKIMRQIVGMHDEILSLCLLGQKEEWLVLAANSPELRLYDMATFQCSLVPGHSSTVVALSSPSWDPSLLASAAKDNNIILWRLRGDAPWLFPLAVCSGHTNTPSALSFSRSSPRPYLLSVAYDTMLKLWPLEEMPKTSVEEASKAPHLRCSSTLKAHAKDATAVDVAPNNSVAVTGGMDKMAKLWAVDAVSMQLGIVGNLGGHRRGVWDARFAPNGERVATCSGDMAVRVFSVASRSVLSTLEGHTSAVLKLLFVNGGSQLMSADSGGILRVWDVNSGGCQVAEEAHNDKVWALIASREEDLYVTGGSDGTITVWEDATQIIEQEELEKAKKDEHDVQTLDNLILGGRYTEALRFALSLERPHCAYKVLKLLSEKGGMDEAVAKLNSDHLAPFLNFIAKWNTNTRYSHLAQEALHCVLLHNAPPALLEKADIGGLLATLLPYTKRHNDRVVKSRQDASLLPYTWKQMRPV